MTELKIYVFDHGWAGADVYVTASEETAKAYFLSDNIETGEEGLRKHMAAHPKQVNPWPAQIEYWKSGAYWNDVRVFDIHEGLEFETTGDN
jgi:hypothetical protein